MRNRIFGGIGALWGGGILLTQLRNHGPSGSGAYAAGQTVALVFGLLLFVVGLYYLIKGGSSSKGS
jgi:hypothetical protein